MKTLPDPKTRVTAPEHVCSIYRQPEEQVSYLVSFLRAGLERGERCLYIAENKRKFAPVLAALKTYWRCRRAVWRADSCHRIVVAIPGCPF